MGQFTLIFKHLSKWISLCYTGIKWIIIVYHEYAKFEFNDISLNKNNTRKTIERKRPVVQ